MYVSAKKQVNCCNRLKDVIFQQNKPIIKGKRKSPKGMYGFRKSRKADKHRNIPINVNKDEKPSFFVGALRAKEKTDLMFVCFLSG